MAAQMAQLAAEQPAEPGEVEEGEAPDITERPSTMLSRDAQLLGGARSKSRRWLRERFDAIARGFEQQATRSDNIDKWWNCFLCVLDDNQFYNGNAEIYVPAVRDAVNARATRFANQLFPQSGRYVESTPADGTQPFSQIALINHYIKEARFKTQVVKPLLKNGDIEGSYHLYYSWAETRRQIVSRETRGVETDAGELEGAEIHDIIEEDIVEGRPSFEVLHDADVLILPATAESPEDAIQRGGSVTIVRRWSKEDLKHMIADGSIRRDGMMPDDLQVKDASMAGLRDTAKNLAKAVGIRSKGPHFIAFETWQLVPLGEGNSFSEDGEKRLCVSWYDLSREPIGCQRNPYWNDRVPLSSAAVEKMAGLCKGQSLVEPVAPLQWEANDAANERADADHYAAMPIIMDGREADNTPLILNLAAIWKAKSTEVQFAEFPDLGQRAMARIQACITGILQTLSVNPAMLPQQSGRQGQKRNQAEVAMEQSVDLLTTAEQVDVLVEGVLNEAVQWMVDLDHQFRDRELTIRQWGELGVEAEMTTIPPLLSRTAYNFNWCGAEQAKMNVAMQQQGTAFLNIARGMRQDLQAEGYQLRIGPLLEKQAITIFGATTGRLTIRDARRQLSIDPQTENDILADGMMVPVSPADDDPRHIQAHQQAMAENGDGDPHGTFRIHIKLHLQQIQARQAAMARQLMQAQGGMPPGAPGAPGVPGGAGPGVPGAPRPGAPQPGAVPAGPRLLKGPPGQIPPEAMPRAGAVIPPRRF